MQSEEPTQLNGAAAIIRAWRDDSFRKTLPEELQRTLPDNPAGVIDLLAAELEIDGATDDLPRTYATACSRGWRCL
jgi:mersacidin/lichenicidin family type 2 lantibiotic